MVPPYGVEQLQFYPADKKSLNMLGHAQISNLEGSSLAIASAWRSVGGRYECRFPYLSPTPVSTAWQNGPIAVEKERVLVFFFFFLS